MSHVRMNFVFSIKKCKRIELEEGYLMFSPLDMNMVSGGLCATTYPRRKIVSDCIFYKYVSSSHIKKLFFYCCMYNSN